MIDFRVIYLFYIIYIQVYDTYTYVSTVLPIVSVWDPKMHHKF